MIRKNQKTIDVAAVVTLFGGKHAIVNSFEKMLKIVLSTKAVEKWIERRSIPTSQLLNLKVIAEKTNIKFDIEDYIK